MRDLARALSNIKLFHYDESFVAVCDERYGTLIFQLGLLYEAIERAIKAEAEVERLRLMVKSITGGLDEAIETIHFLEAENARLRKVVEAARATKLAFDIAVNYPDKESLHHYNLNNSVYIAVTLLFEALEDLGTDYE